MKAKRRRPGGPKAGVFEEEITPTISPPVMRRAERSEPLFALRKNPFPTKNIT
jgi:hypothetical protein